MGGSAEQVLSEHGFSGERLLKLCRKIANDKLARLGGFMHEQRLEDLVGYLALQGVQAEFATTTSGLKRDTGRVAGIRSRAGWPTSSTTDWQNLSRPWPTWHR